jgi:hypothetical protein
MLKRSPLPLHHNFTKNTLLVLRGVFSNFKTVFKMKNIAISLFILFGFIACENNKPKEATQTTAPVATETKAEVKTDTTHVHVFTCPMHPEVTGKEGDKCPKCSMALEHKD